MEGALTASARTIATPATATTIAAAAAPAAHDFFIAALPLASPSYRGAEKSARLLDRFFQAAPYRRNLDRQTRKQTAGACAVEDHENTPIGLTADQPPKRLLQTQARDQIIVFTAEPRAPRLVQDRRLGPC